MKAMPEFLAAEELGKRVLEMADRVNLAAKVVPGAVASYSFAIEGVEFQLLVRMKNVQS